MVTHNKYWVIIPAAGIGTRMQSTVPKQYLEIHGKSILAHSLECFLNIPAIEKIVTVLNPAHDQWQTLPYKNHAKIILAWGAEHRCQSVLNGLLALADLATVNDWVLVHDAVRPFIKPYDVEKLINEVGDDPIGGILGSPVIDTIKKVVKGRIVETVDRTKLWRALTPQMFRYGLLVKALQAVIARQELVTDEAAAMELIDLKPMIVEGSKNNIKITTTEDLATSNGTD